MAFTVSRSRIAPCAAKSETTYATDPTIAGASDGFNTINSEIVFNSDIQFSEFRNHGSTFTRGKDVPGQRVMGFNFTTQLQGSGTAGTAVQGVDAALKAAGLTGTVSASTSVTYAPQTIASLKSAAIAADHNGLKAQALGCYCNVTARARAGEPTFLTFAAQGIFATPTIGTISSWGAGATGVQRAVANLGITATIYNGTDSWTAPTITEYEFDAGNDIRRIPDMLAATGLKALLFADRNPRLTTTLVLDTDTAGIIIQADEFYANAAAATTSAITLVHGATAGNINTWSFPTAQPENPVIGSGDGFRTLQIPWKIQSSTAEGEMTLVQT